MPKNLGCFAAWLTFAPLDHSSSWNDSEHDSSTNQEKFASSTKSSGSFVFGDTMTRKCRKRPRSRSIEAVATRRDCRLSKRDRTSAIERVVELFQIERCRFVVRPPGCRMSLETSSRPRGVMEPRVILRAVNAEHSTSRSCSSTLQPLSRVTARCSKRSTGCSLAIRVEERVFLCSRMSS